MKILLGGLLGLATVLALVAVPGFVWGGPNRVAPCHSAPDFLTGGMFGLLFSLDEYGIPAGLIGALSGVVTVLRQSRTRNSP